MRAKKNYDYLQILSDMVYKQRLAYAEQGLAFAEQGLNQN